ncbi:D-alanine--D-alanine ligase [Candidatus Vallotiella sp. (ex Adelges kitamiensis)]|uniref:D-alanine--D-alanine ligase n=1 Tax=Candidatus Vallotiella sp. (ex Adelges kitamiensis) TaxID=2864217 RepID=UPI001CE2C0CB|nr:D-alanine--D-alanine ligase [Candidatus Vallotia sp. (ex Adelges kitamiensis)]
MPVIDPKKFGKVAVLYGGESSECDVSLVSGLLVYNRLRDIGVEAHLFDPKNRPLSALIDERFVRAFIALHGGYGENGQIQAALDFYGIQYTGPGVLGSALGMDKFRTKLIWQQVGIPTPPFDMVLRGDDYNTRAGQIISKLGLPLFVKPATEGSSISVIKVRATDNLPYALAQAAQHDPVVLVEKSIEGGGEYTACVAGSLQLPLIRIVPAGEFYDYHAKYISNDTQYRIPCGLSDAKERWLTKLARRAFEILACPQWGRADFMLDSDGNPYFLEINTAPGMTDHSLLPKAAHAAGITYSELLMNVLTLTLKD